MQDLTVFPPDMFTSDQPDRDWNSLREQTSAAAMKRIDLSYLVYLQEEVKQKKGAIERAALRLGMEGEDIKRGVQVVGDNVKIFRLFRVPEEHGGLGMSRDTLARYSQRRLRVFAQNKDWSGQNRSRIPELLEQKDLGEEKIRALINSERGVTARTATEEWLRLRFAFTLQDGMMVQSLLAAVKRRREAVGEPLRETGADGKKLPQDYLDGLLLQEIFVDWMNGDSGMVDDAGNPIINVDFMKGGRFAAEPEEPEEQDDAHSNAAD